MLPVKSAQKVSATDGTIERSQHSRFPMLENFLAVARQLKLKTAERFPFLVPKKRGSIQHYLLAIVLMVFALWVRLVIAPIESGLQYLTFFPAVALAAIAGGYRAGMLAAILGIGFATYIFTPPYYSFSSEVFRSSLWSNIVFLMDGIIVSFSIEAMHRYRQKYAIELKQSNEAYTALRVSENKFHLLFESANDCLMLLSADGRILDINRCGYERLGYTKEEMLGRRISEFDPPEFADRVPERVAKVMRDGQATFESAHLRKNGSKMPVEINSMLVDLGKGKMLYSIIRDITERKKAEEALRKSEANLLAMLDNSPYLSWLKDTEGRYITINKVFADYLRLKNPKQAIGKTDLDLQPKELAEKYRADDVEVMATRQQKHVEESAFDGKNIHWVETYKTPIVDAHGNVLGTVGFASDITERKQAELMLRESAYQIEKKELAKTRFLAAAGHDLRQPLAAASLYIDTLSHTNPTRKQNEVIQRLKQVMDTFKGLLDALLNISKLDADVIKPEYTSINVAELFIWLEENFASIASNKQIDFRLFFSMKGVVVVCSDIGLVKSILMNLVSNAIKFTPKGAILVSARRRGDDVLFQVWDTGIGIQDEYIKQIFDEFYQINNPQRDRTKGLGLGLAIAERALALLGGKIECRSQIGHGSVFGFRLPLCPASNSSTQQTAHVALQDNVVNDWFAKGKHFVVVEDDALVAEAMRQALAVMGGKVECFHNAEDAILHTNIECADYYIVDYMLGGTLNGIQFLNQLRQKFGQPINAVVVTGETSLIFAGMADCDWPVLYKPVNISQLLICLSGQAMNCLQRSAD